MQTQCAGRWMMEMLIEPYARCINVLIFNADVLWWYCEQLKWQNIKQNNGNQEDERMRG
jgi:hypothetical protein